MIIVVLFLIGSPNFTCDAGAKLTCSRVIFTLMDNKVFKGGEVWRAESSDRVVAFRCLT